MFSEYASRFLAQSQIKASTFVGQNDTNGPPSSRPGYDPSRSRQPHPSLVASRSNNPYQQNNGTASNSRFGSLAFGSRLAQAQEAPLFHSHYEDFQDDEDDDDDRGREAADLYALQRSRRVAAASKLAESMGSEGDGSTGSLDQSRGGRSSFADDYDDEEDSDESEGRPIPRFQSSFRNTLRSSYDGARYNQLRQDKRKGKVIDKESEPGDSYSQDGPVRDGRLVDVGLESQTADDDPPASLMGDGLVDSSPTPFQRFRDDSEHHPLYNGRSARFDESELDESRTQAIVVTTPVEAELFKHDPFYAWLYLIMLASLFSTSFLVWLHTSAPDSSHPIGDTIYTTLEGSLYMLASDTIIAVMVALIWLAALQSFVRPTVVLIVVGMPLICVSFFMYPFISSFHGRGGVQESAMRWASGVPLVVAAIWVYCVYKGRNSIRQAIEILEFSASILKVNSALVLVGVGSLAAIVVWTWLWISMFARVFLDGYMSVSKAQWIIKASTWWLGAWFVFMYMWTVSIINETHRAASAATVSQWYFHRNTVPVTPSADVVHAAVNHALTVNFGTICFSTLLARLIRLPILVLPARISRVIQSFINMLMPTSIVALTNPLTITYAGIHSQPLIMSARGLSSMEFLGPQTPTVTLTPRVFSTRSSERFSSLVPYRFAKLLLHATRFVMAIAMGFAGWVVTARQLAIEKPDGGMLKGSLYAYIVGLVASFIGYSVMGAMESILGNIVDAVAVCYGSERRMQNGVGAYCMEAAHLFGGRRRGEDDYS